ncbi:4Fe-4S single cluster domain-containing protein [Heliorestis convoluta]|uniref:Anaerobic ribonucleoside-triphosphate reductase-activating protein n=1 Tax=Heliorestis convoluta TaxID=356322 RepID=A0A5Q2MXW7_9FIRM|nr:4Fe-4S single cluster domain-containing protein [Heliorestis convoluta]QGG47674.1 anaerobic ribonucleoside-triphosphate reductase activating protein [Heliorestis convoluta]
MNTTDAVGIAFTVFFQGCSIRCLGCHNPELQSFDGGQAVAISDIVARIKKHRKFYDALVFVGGEPLDQKSALQQLLNEGKNLGLATWLYTGYEIDEVPSEFLALCDVIVAGPYKEELKTNSFPASSNQVVMDRRKGEAA